MKLIALTSIFDGPEIKPPGSPIDVSSTEGDVLVGRKFARHPTDDELAKHWPAEAAAQAKAAAEADAKAAADAAPATKVVAAKSTKAKAGGNG